MAYLSKDVAFVSHSLSLSVRETHLQQGLIHHCRINEDKLHKCMCVHVNIYSLLIVRVMKPLYSKYRWGSMWPLKKFCEYFLVHYLLTFVVCVKAFARDAVTLAMLLLVVQHSHWLNYSIVHHVTELEWWISEISLSFWETKKSGRH